MMRFFTLPFALLAFGCTPEAEVQSVPPVAQPQAVAVAEVPYNAVPTKISDLDDEARLLNNSGISLQWISWETRGQLKSGKRDGEIWLSGAQFARDGGEGALYLEGRVVEIGTGYFIFSGEIVIEDTPDDGRICRLKGDDLRFEVTQGRKYWRLRKFEWCDGLTDYIDIYY